MTIKEKILDIIFPPRCPFCDDVLKSGEVFCIECQSAIMENKKAKFTHEHDFAFSKIVFAANYSDEIKPAVVRLKRINGSAEVEVFAKLLAFTVLKELSNEVFDYVTAVPMSETKLKERGYNQAEALAISLAQKLSLPYIDGLLIQLDDFSAQHTLRKKQREDAANERYTAVKGAKISGRVLLVDDIITTGSTINRCAKLLKELGADDVVAAAALATPKRQN